MRDFCSELGSRKAAIANDSIGKWLQKARKNWITASSPMRVLREKKQSSKVTGFNGLEAVISPSCTKSSQILIADIGYRRKRTFAGDTRIS